MNDYLDNLSKLREIPSPKTHSDKLFALSTLLHRLESGEVMQVALDRAEFSLIQFDQTHPSDSWARGYLNKIKAAIKNKDTNNELLLDMDVKSSDRIVSTLKNAIIALRAMAVTRNDPDKYVKHAVEAIDWIFTTEIYTLMRKISPELARLHDETEAPIQKRLNEQAVLSIQVRNQPAVSELEHKLWLNLADTLESLLKSKNQESN